jgi:hypothetical protein
MKKSIILLALPALALTGCASAITAAEAKEAAQKIAEHKFTEEELKEFKALTVSADVKMEMSGKVSGKEGAMKEDAVTVIEISADKKFVHTKFEEKGSEKEGDKEESGEMLAETWLYVKDGAFYSVMHNKSHSEGEDSESKQYYVLEGVEEAVTKGFENALLESVKSAVKAASGEDYLPEVLASAEEQPEDSPVKYDVKYASSGDGSLVFKGSAEYKDYVYNGVKSSGSAKAKYVWDNYLLTEAAASMKLHGEEGEDVIDVNMEVKETLKFKAKVSYPSLDGYEKVSLL